MCKYILNELHQLKSNCFDIDHQPCPCRSTVLQRKNALGTFPVLLAWNNFPWVKFKEFIGFKSIIDDGSTTPANFPGKPWTKNLIGGNHCNVVTPVCMVDGCKKFLASELGV